MSFFLVFLAVVLVGAVLWLSVGNRSGATRGRQLPGLLDAGFEQPPANLPPILLPADAAPRDVDRVRFSLGLRGYRMDQVDQVLDELRDQLMARDREIEALQARLHAVEQETGRDTVPAVRAGDAGDAETAATRPAGNEAGQQLPQPGRLEGQA